MENTIVYVRIHGHTRKSFEDPTDFEWNKDKDNRLWQEISTSTNLQNIDWEKMSESFAAPDYFIKKKVYYIFSKQIQLLENVKESVLHKRVAKTKENRFDSEVGVDKEISSTPSPFSKKNYEINSDSTFNLPRQNKYISHHWISSSAIPENSREKVDVYSNYDSKNIVQKDQNIFTDSNTQFESTDSNKNSLLLFNEQTKQQSPFSPKSVSKGLEISNSDNYSTASISKSALEDALLDRLNINDD